MTMNKPDIVINLSSTEGMNTGDIANILTMLDSNEKVKKKDGMTPSFFF